MREILSLTQGRSVRGKHPTELLLQSCKHFSKSACFELEGSKVLWKQVTTDRKGPLGSGKFLPITSLKSWLPKGCSREKERQTGKVAPRGNGCWDDDGYRDHLDFYYCLSTWPWPCSLSWQRLFLRKHVAGRSRGQLPWVSTFVLLWAVWPHVLYLYTGTIHSTLQDSWV